MCCLSNVSRDFFFASHFSALASSRSTKRKGRCMCKNRNNALVPDGCSGTGNQAQLTIVACRSRQSCCPGDAHQFALLLRYDTTTSMRPFGHSTGQLLWTDVGLSTTRQEGAATRICATVHSREHHQRRAGACDRPNWAVGYSQGDHPGKKEQQ